MIIALFKIYILVGCIFTILEMWSRKYWNFKDLTLKEFLIIFIWPITFYYCIKVLTLSDKDKYEVANNIAESMTKEES